MGYKPPALVQAICFQYVPSKDSIYFTDNVNQKLSRVHVNGGTVTDIRTGVNPFGIAVDAAAGKIYWSDPSGNTINRCSMGGTGNQVIVSGATEADYSRILKLDLVNNKIYWTDANLGTIKRANLDGTSLQTLITGQGNIVGLELDVPNNKMYWTSYSFNQLFRANLDGTGQTSLSFTSSLPLGVTLDRDNQKLYVACGFGSNLITRFNINGTGATNIATGLNVPYEIQYLPQLPNVLTVTDVNGNTSSCTSYITVRDSIRPTATCQNLALSLNSGGNASTTAAALNNGSTDNCSVFTMAASQTAFTCANIGNTAVTLTVTDPSGNTSTCTSTVTVQDVTAPTIFCPSNVTVNNTLNQCGATVTYSTPVGTDNCSGAITTRTAGQASGTLFPIGTTTNTFQVTDGSGNTATCSFTVTVNDNQAPPSPAPAISAAEMTLGFVPRSSPLLCPHWDGQLPRCQHHADIRACQRGDVSDWHHHQRVRVTDASGNASICSFNVVITDTQAPSISCPGNISGTNDPGLCSKIVTFTAPTGSDNCPGSVMSQTTGFASGAAYVVGTTTNTFRVTDAAGNTTSCSFTITITDAQAPTITCPANVSSSNDPGQCSKVVSFTNPVGTDNCPGPVTVQTTGLPSGSAFPIGTTTNTFRVTDGTKQYGHMLILRHDHRQSIADDHLPCERHRQQ
ncbi:MAG: HYR domain-containing protein [Bacteroidia bacterium]